LVDCLPLRMVLDVDVELPASSLERFPGRFNVKSLFIEDVTLFEVTGDVDSEEMLVNVSLFSLDDKSF
jgi:hypothetical protein